MFPGIEQRRRAIVLLLSAWIGMNSAVRAVLCQYSTKLTIDCTGARVPLRVIY